MKDQTEHVRFIQSEVATAIFEAFGKLGIDINAVIGGASSNPGERLSEEALYDFWKQASSLGAMQLATMVAQSIPAGELGLLDFLVHNSPTLDVVLHHVTRHLDYSYKGAELRLTIEGSQARLHYKSPGIAPVAALWTAAFAHARIRGMVGDEWKLDSASFQFASPSDADDIQSYFGCPVSYDSDDTSLVFPLGLLDLPVQAANPKLYSVLLRQLDHELSEMRKRSTSTADRLRLAAEEHLSRNDLSLEQLAMEVGIPVSEARREMQDLGHNGFPGFLDDLRKDLAHRWLTYEDRAIRDIANSLGYSDAANLSRASRRWFGCSPSAYRKRSRR